MLLKHQTNYKADLQCYWELPLPPCLLLSLSSLPQMCIHIQSRASWSGARERPYSLSAETALSNSVSRLRGGKTPLSTVILQLFTSCPRLCLSHLVNPHTNKGKQPRTFQAEARAALLTQCMWKAPAQCERLAGQAELHLQKVIALEPSGALL